MQKDWDQALPDPRVWVECLRVLKDGAFCFVMSSPRQDCLSRIIASLEDAGFFTGFTSLYWAFASGFPKAGNISKLVDKQLGVEREKIIVNPNSRPESKIKGGMAFDRGLEKPESVGAGLQYITKPTSLEAKRLDGSYTGFNPKPALEAILVCMKPLSEKSYTEQALKNSKSVTWLDDCRIPFVSDSDRESSRFGTQTDIKGGGFGSKRPSEGDVLARNVLSSQKGRFPANLLISDNVLEDGRERQASRRQSRYCTPSGSGIYQWNSERGKDSSDKVDGFGDSGGFSRYFSLDAWWAKRIKNLPESVRRTFPFLVVPKPSRAEKNTGLGEIPERQVTGGGGMTVCADKFGSTKALQSNTHPTCKPLKLFAYLVTLGSRKGDVVLDPFIGSGTTAIAARLLGRRFIGYEKESDYHRIALARVAATPQLEKYVGKELIRASKPTLEELWS